MKCLHCESKNAKYGHRGLCYPCYMTPGVKEKYPRGWGTTNVPTGMTNANPTMDELDALVAEQMQCLPDWWERDQRLMGNPLPEAEHGYR